MRHSAKRFFSKALAAPHTSTPRVITVDKNAAYPKAFKELKAEEIMPALCELRQSTYLNNVVEQDHRFMKRLVKLGMASFRSRARGAPCRGFEVMNMIRKGQMHGVGKGDIVNQVMFIASLFGVAS